MCLPSTDLRPGVGTTCASTRRCRYHGTRSPCFVQTTRVTPGQSSSKFAGKFANNCLLSLQFCALQDAHSCTHVPAGTALAPPPAAGGAGSNPEAPPKSSSSKVEAATSKRWQQGNSSTIAAPAQLLACSNVHKGQQRSGSTPAASWMGLSLL